MRLAFLLLSVSLVSLFLFSCSQTSTNTSEGGGNLFVGTWITDSTFESVTENGITVVNKAGYTETTAREIGVGDANMATNYSRNDTCYTKFSFPYRLQGTDLIYTMNNGVDTLQFTAINADRIKITAQYVEGAKTTTTISWMHRYSGPIPPANWPQDTCQPDSGSNGNGNGNDTNNTQLVDSLSHSWVLVRMDGCDTISGNPVPFSLHFNDSASFEIYTFNLFYGTYNRIRRWDNLIQSTSGSVMLSGQTINFDTAAPVPFAFQDSLLVFDDEEYMGGSFMKVKKYFKRYSGILPPQNWPAIEGAYLNFPRPGTIQVKGHVTMESGAPVKQQSMMISDSLSTLLAFYTDTTGSFSFFLQPQRYTFSTISNGALMAHLGIMADTSIRVSASDDSIRFSMTMYPFDTTISGIIIDTITTTDPRGGVQFALFLQITGSTTSVNMIMAGNGVFSIPVSSHFPSYRLTSGRQRNSSGANFILDPQSVDDVVPGANGMIFKVKQI